MTYAVTSAVGVLVFCVIAPTFPAWSQNPPRSSSDPDNPQTIVPSEKGRPELQASDLSVRAECSAIYAGERSALFQWTPVARGQRSRLDVTRYYDGFERGTFYTLATLDQSAISFTWTQGEPAAAYRWRVLTLVQNKWYASKTAYYEVPVCVVDEEEEDEKDPNRLGYR
ncbi:MAG: hypothetical protein AAF933_12645 [Pseudomonadota bacterium]